MKEEKKKLGGNTLRNQYLLFSKLGKISYFLKTNPDSIATDDAAGNDIINAAISNTQAIKNIKCSTVLLDFML